MTTMSVTPRNASGELDSESLKLCMSAFKAVLIRLMREYVGDRVITSFTPDTKRLMKLSQKLDPPYMMVGLRSIQLLKDRGNVLAMSKAGVVKPRAYRIQSATPIELAEVQGPHPRYVDEVKVFPVMLSLNVTYVDTDVERTIDAGAKMLLHGMLRAFSFEATYANVRTEIVVRPDDPITLSAADVDWVDMESEDQPGFQSFVIPCTMWANLFVFGKVPVLQKLVFQLSAGSLDDQEHVDQSLVEITKVG